MSPREIADNVVELLAARAFAKGIGLGCHVAPDVPQIITADPGRVRQVLLNLIGNAIKFTDTGGVLVTVARSARRRRSTASASPWPTPGPACARRTWSASSRNSNRPTARSTRAHGGAGLGLAISRRLVDRHGRHDFGVERARQGLGIRLRNPGHRSHRGAADARPACSSGRRAVIVSKNAVEADAIARTIRAHGGSVDIAATAAQAADLAGDCDALLVDAAIGRRRRQAAQAAAPEPASPAAEAITMIAPTDRGMLGEFRASGYATFLARPVRGETLLRVLLAGHRRRAAAAPAGKPARRPSAPPAAARPGLSVLIAEDNDINAMLARATLLKAGHRVEVVGNGKAAVEAVTGGGRKQRYDVVLMDLHMPVMDGLDAIAAIRRHEEERACRRCRSWCCRPTARKRPGTRCSPMAPAASSPSRSIPTRWCMPSRSRRLA